MCSTFNFRDTLRALVRCIAFIMLSYCTAKKPRTHALKKLEEEVARQQEDNRAQIAEFDRQADLFHKRKKTSTAGASASGASASVGVSASAGASSSSRVINIPAPSVKNVEKEREEKKVERQ